MAEKAQLYGIQEILMGHEDRIISCMPIIKYDNRIGAVRGIYWDIISGKGIN